MKKIIIAFVLMLSLAAITAVVFAQPGGGGGDTSFWDEPNLDDIFKGPKSDLPKVVPGVATVDPPIPPPTDDGGGGGGGGGGIGSGGGLTGGGGGFTFSYNAGLAFNVPLSGETDPCNEYLPLRFGISGTQKGVSDVRGAIGYVCEPNIFTREARLHLRYGFGPLTTSDLLHSNDLYDPLFTLNYCPQPGSDTSQRLLDQLDRICGTDW